ncbi:hypothetical protein LTR10_015628 [Elasticomyces elasticus]|uniref:Helicase C-terminal domain-containing protein n=1 Tax=Exophiala sideris TaxID=1016849 RepID=A0ABR0JN53_9EURO|nr:hypothetical protein LTR10_015628 [Elasticomyces elasticus]KAK5036337.1 hypothetical protein LTS07_002064 [Exophiala sideris]KAK5041831.1 hypothetical protein LTR13_002498 [Exophiala sideris]KAK5066721.1 hypothetical protein LTR69_002068 [Exophiala sideris]KAK5184779.1 hypothetical protein LTR44_002625 [Eurotiomycetes sp. CCFEE 6388]
MNRRTYVSKVNRMLLLLSTWTGFHKIEHRFRAEHTEKLLKRRDLLADIMSWYCEASPGTQQPTDLGGRLAMLCQGAPKIRALLRLVRRVVVKDLKKIVIFASLPAQQVLLLAILKALEIPVAVYHGHLSSQMKRGLKKRFNDEQNPMVLIGSYAITSCGLNLQHQCHWGAFLDPPPSKAMGEQAGARIHRVGQESTGQLVTFSTKGTLNDRQYVNNLLNLLNTRFIDGQFQSGADTQLEIMLTGNRYDLIESQNLFASIRHEFPDPENIMNLNPAQLSAVKQYALDVLSATFSAKDLQPARRSC